MSLVGYMAPVTLGTLLTTSQFMPPSVETQIGARLLSMGGPAMLSSVKAEAANCIGFWGLIVRVGSESWLVSPLRDAGIMLTTVIWAAAAEAMRRSAMARAARFTASPPRSAATRVFGCAPAAAA